VALEIQSRYRSPDEAEADIRRRVAEREVIIGFGHPVYTISDPRSEIVKEVARELAVESGDMGLFSVAERIESVMHDAKRMFLIWIGTAPLRTTRWAFPSTCLHRCLSSRARRDGART